MDEAVGLAREILTQYGLPIALLVLVVIGEGIALYKLWDRNQKLFDKLLEKGGSEGESDPARVELELESAIEDLQQALAANAEALLAAVRTAIVERGDGREVERLLADLDRLRADLAHERAQTSALHEKRFTDVRALHAEQIETMRSATQAIEKLSAMLQGAMRRPQ